MLRGEGGFGQLKGVESALIPRYQLAYARVLKASPASFRSSRVSVDYFTNGRPDSRGKAVCGGPESNW